MSRVKLLTQGRGYPTTFAMSPAYFGPSGILSRNLIQVNVRLKNVNICGYIYIQIKVKTKMWNFMLKTLHYFLNNLSLKLLLIPTYINLNKCKQCISCKCPVICVMMVGQLSSPMHRICILTAYGSAVFKHPRKR
jgi:hypothetical protein